MVLCSVAEVRAIVDPKTLTDSDVEGIVSHASNVIALNTGASVDASENAHLNTACIHMSAALVLQKMKFTGELAAQIKLGNESQSNSVDADIQKHEQLADGCMKRYRYAVSGYSILYGRAGFRTVNSGE
ncbi:MAG: hypothetical protein Q8J68_08930 [Methanolobus sp.]|uniref:hypothetical protein n=1 Tax=Methanolobus sp. TaxID=1874737 RepID=UPI002731C002|nr:hypothetical protein [Methanolobus sp.]MDP2217396.1 hypothetical protein [Methanolobus sp.]